MELKYKGLDEIAEESKCLPGRNRSCHIDVYCNPETGECFGNFEVSENNFLVPRRPFEFAFAIARPHSVTRLAEKLDDWQKIRKEGMDLIGNRWPKK